MKGAGKTSYEIRSDLLRLSFDILASQFEAMRLERQSGENPTAPSTEAVLKEALKLNKFVSDDHRS